MLRSDLLMYSETLADAPSSFFWNRAVHPEKLLPRSGSSSQLSTSCSNTSLPQSTGDESDLSVRGMELHPAGGHQARLHYSAQNVSPDKAGRNDEVSSSSPDLPRRVRGSSVPAQPTLGKHLCASCPNMHFPFRDEEEPDPGRA